MTSEKAYMKKPNKPQKSVKRSLSNTKNVVEKSRSKPHSAKGKNIRGLQTPVDKDRIGSKNGKINGSKRGENPRQKKNIYTEKYEEPNYL